MAWWNRSNKVKAHTGQEQNIPIDIQIDTIEPFEQQRESENRSKFNNQAKAFSQFVWVYAAVTHISDAGSLVPFRIYDMSGDEAEGKVVPNHPALRLLNYPNFHTSRFELWEQTLTHLELQGNAYWFIDDSDGFPRSIEILRPHEISPHAHKKLFIDFYVYEVNNRKIQIPARNIIHFKRYHPLKKYVGLSTIEAAARTLEMEDKRFRYDKSFFANNARPSGVLTTDGILSPEVQKRLERAWRDRFKGEENAHKTALLMGGVKFQSVGLPPKDAEFLALRALDRDETLAMYGVSTSNLGIVKDVNKSNAEAMFYMFMRDTIRPKLARIQEKLTHQLIKRYYGPEFEGRFDEIDVATRDQILKEMQIVGKIGVVTVNEFRMKYLKMKPVNGGDTLISAAAAKDLEDLMQDVTEYENDGIIEG